MKPLPSEIRAARIGAGHSQQAAAETIHETSLRTWQNWELGVSPMRYGLYELYLIKTNQEHLMYGYKKP